MGVLDELQGSKVYIDTSPFIYFVEGVAPLATLLVPLFEAIDRGRVTGVTGEITRAECLVKPFRDSNPKLVSAFQGVIRRRAHFHVEPVTLPIWERAAWLRSQHKVKLPDAVHMAVAEHVGCTSFITNDRGFENLTALRVIVLSDLVIP